MTEQTAMDGNLLLSVLGGLGRADVSGDGAETYIKDDDCVGGPLQSCDSAQHAEGCLSRPHDDDADLSL